MQGLLGFLLGLLGFSPRHRSAGLPEEAIALEIANLVPSCMPKAETGQQDWVGLGAKRCSLGFLSFHVL